MRLKASRNLDQPGSERDFKLGTHRKWIVNFFDMSGAGAYSSIMDLYLINDSISQDYLDEFEIMDTDLSLRADIKVWKP